MLVSHRKRFIFTKTAKTASTSVEAFFEPFCMADGEWSLSHGREQYDGQNGIIGYRGPSTARKWWRDHMSASSIRAKLPADVWQEYFKFCVIRNPFDRLVSGFHWLLHEERKGNLTGRWHIVRNLVPPLRDPFARSKGDDEIERFRDWLQLGGDFCDRDKYMIDDQICVDFFIRFESLNDGLSDVCQRLDIEFDPTQLPKLKFGLRDSSLQPKYYYDRRSIEIVRMRYRFELEHFGYEMD